MADVFRFGWSFFVVVSEDVDDSRIGLEEAEVEVEVEDG